MSSFMDRVVGAARLDVRTYEEVEADGNATGQAVAVVLLSSIAAGIGEGLGVGLFSLMLGAAGSLIGWVIWAALTSFIGTKLLPEPQTDADFGQLFRTLGFSASPGILRVFVLVPVVGWVLEAIVGIWMLIAMVIAVRQALDYKSTWRAVGVCFIGWLVFVAIAVVIGTGMAAGFAAAG
jgi:hypothetical protein